MRLSKFKNFFIIGGSAVLVGVVSFAITINVFSKADRYYSEIARNELEDQKFVSGESSIRTNPVLIDNEEKIANLDSKENDILAQEIIKEVENEILEDDKTVLVVKDDAYVDDVVEDDIKAVSTEPVKEEITFIKPIEGEVILDFAIDKLVYSQTLEEWITHTGVDLQGEIAMPVKVSTEGKIVSKKVDPRYGNTIIVEHSNNFKTIYSNLSTLDLVETNQEVKQGDIISGVGDGYGFEALEGPHIHFEILKDGEYVNPIDYFVLQ